MRRAWLLLPAAALAVPIAGLIAANATLSADAVRTRLQDQLRRATGRELTIGGPVRLAWSLTPTIELHDVSLANPPGFSRPEMAHAEAIEATIALLPLLSRHVAIDRLLLASPDVLLERNAAGRANWDFTPPPNPAPAGPAAASAGGGRYDLVLDRVDVRDATLGWHGQGLALSVPRFGYDRADGQVHGDLVKSGVPLALTGTAEPVAGGPWKLALHLVSAGLDATLAGTSDAARLVVAAPDLAALSPLAQASLLPLHDAQAEASLGAAGLHDLQLRIGATPLGPVAVQTMSIAAPSWTGPAVVQGTARLGALPVAIDGQAGTLASLVAGRATPISLRAAADDAQLEVHGTVAPGGPVEFELSGQAGDLARLGAAAQLALPSVHDGRIAAKVSLASTTATLTGLQVTSREGDLAGQLTLATAGLPSVAGALTSTHLDLDALAAPRPVAPAPAPPQVPAAPVGAAPPGANPGPPSTPARVIPDFAIPYDALRRADANVEWHVGEAIWHRRALHDLRTSVSLQGGTLQLMRTSVAVGDRRLDLGFVVDAGAQRVAATAEGAGLPAGPALALLGVLGDGGGMLDVRMDLKGQGATLRAVLATLTGSAGLALVDGEIDNAWLQGMLAAVHLPLEAGERSKVRCAAIALEAASGRIVSRALSLDSAKLALDGGGELNLADETMDLHLSPQLRLGTALSVPVRVRGSWLAPKVALDPGAIAPGRVGILLGGPAPADTCDPALAVARGREAGPAPATAPPAAVTGKPVKPADLLRSLLR